MAFAPDFERGISKFTQLIDRLRPGVPGRCVSDLSLPCEVRPTDEVKPSASGGLEAASRDESGRFEEPGTSANSTMLTLGIGTGEASSQHKRNARLDNLRYALSPHLVMICHELNSDPLLLLPFLCSPEMMALGKEFVRHNPMESLRETRTASSEIAQDLFFDLLMVNYGVPTTYWTDDASDMAKWDLGRHIVRFVLRAEAFIDSSAFLRLMPCHGRSFISDACFCLAVLSYYYTVPDGNGLWMVEGDGVAAGVSGLPARRGASSEVSLNH